MQPAEALNSWEALRTEHLTDRSIPVWFCYFFLIFHSFSTFLLSAQAFIHRKNILPLQLPPFSHQNPLSPPSLDTPSLFSSSVHLLSLFIVPLKSEAKCRVGLPSGTIWGRGEEREVASSSGKISFFTFLPFLLSSIYKTTNTEFFSVCVMKMRTLNSREVD